MGIYFRAMSVLGCDVGGITRRSYCKHNCCEGENCITWLEKQFRRLDELETELVELREAQRWIPVGERLPAVSEYRNGDKFKSMDSNELVPFLVCCEDTEIPFRAFYDGKNWGDGWGKQNVTHWQPLPQPPQKGE